MVSTRRGNGCLASIPFQGEFRWTQPMARPPRHPGWLYSRAGMSSTPASLVLFGIAVAAYTLAVVAFVLHLAFRKRILGDIGMALVLIGWPIHFASIFTRALEAGHWPLGNMYEYSTGI